MIQNFTYNGLFVSIWSVCMFPMECRFLAFPSDLSKTRNSCVCDHQPHMKVCVYRYMTQGVHIVSALQKHECTIID